MTRNYLLFLFFIILCVSCERETCYNCKSYDTEIYEQNLDNFEDEFEMCEFDGIWEEISWRNNEANPGGELSFIDLDKYIMGFRAIQNPDLDNDGIINAYDSDIDGDSIENNNDLINDLVNKQIIQELIICSENGK